MLGEDSLSGRFDYLFEPLDEDASDSGADGVGDPRFAPDRGEPGTAAPARMAFAAFILAALGAVAVVAILLVQRPNAPARPVDSAVDQAPPPTLETDASPLLAPPPPQPVDPQPADAPASVEAVPEQQDAPQPVPTRPEEAARSPATPITRAPISVAPEARPAFPNQGPQQGGANEGNLIPGAGLPGPL